MLKIVIKSIAKYFLQFKHAAYLYDMYIQTKYFTYSEKAHISYSEILLFSMLSKPKPQCHNTLLTGKHTLKIYSQLDYAYNLLNCDTYMYVICVLKQLGGSFSTSLNALKCYDTTGDGQTVQCLNICRNIKIQQKTSNKQHIS